MKKITLSSAGGSTQKTSTIFIGNHLIEEATKLGDLSQYSQVFVITDEHVGPLWLDKLLSGLPGKVKSIVLPPGEEPKHIDTVQTIWSALQKAGCDRKSLVINLGGGVVTDMGGFAASTYMRGIETINIPTTLVAQVDASIGGKTGIDFAGLKNLIGTFHQPTSIIIDTQTLTTLPDDQFVAGFAEIIKHGLILDNSYYQTVTSKPPRQFTADELRDVIYRSCAIKAEIVRKDPKESGLRKILNFGHTIGHAIEAISLESDHPLLHGQAVAIGMVAEAKLSQLLGMIPDSDLHRIEQDLKHAGLPISYTGLATSEVLQKMQSDKKNEHGAINFNLLEGIGKAAYNQTPPVELIDQAITYVVKENS